MPEHGVPKIDSRIIRTGVRPPRVAVLIDSSDAQWMHTCLRVIEWSTAFWGGWYTCLVPTNGNEIAEPFWTLLEKFDPDYLYTYQKTGRDCQLASPMDFMRDFRQQLEDWMQKHPDQDRDTLSQALLEAVLERDTNSFEISEDLTGELFSRLNPFAGPIHGCVARSEDSTYGLTSLQIPFKGYFRKSNTERSDHFKDIDIVASLPIQLMVHSLYGKQWVELRRRLYTSDSEQFHLTSHSTIDKVGEQVEALWRNENYLYESTVAAASLLKCSFYYPIEHSISRDPILFVIGDTIEDYCLYHSLSRLRRRVIWLPKCLLEAFRIRIIEQGDHDSCISIDEETLTYRALTLWGTQATTKSDTRFTSISLRKEELTEIAQQFIEWAGRLGAETNGISAQTEYDISKLLPYVRRLYETNNDSNLSREQFHDGKSVTLLTPPKPKHFGTVPPTDFFWITEVDIEGYKLPPRPEFGPETIYHEKPEYDSGQVRVTAEGFGFFCPNIVSGSGDIDRTLVRPTICIQNDFKIFETIFKKAGYDIRYSDKGNYQLHSTQMFGGLEGLTEFLRQPYNQRLVEEYLRPVKERNGYGFRGHDRRFLTFKDMTKIFNGEVDVGAVLEDLVGRGMLYRGYVFQCEACRNHDWYPIEAISHEFVCSRCRKSQRYTKRHWREPDEPEWFYQLDEVFYQACNHNFKVPILTLRCLQRRASSFLYVPELEIRTDPKSSDPDCEMDIFCCLDGQIVIGECKKRNKITRDDLIKYRGIADNVRADTIVLSTMDDDWGDVAKNTTSIFGKRCLELLCRSDLTNFDK